MLLAHETLWKKFYNEETNLIYDIEFTDPSQFPTPEEVASSIPNCCGWSTGMEDCALHGGFMLDGLVAAYRVTREEEWKEKARKIFKGLVALGSTSKTKGFVARGFSPRTRDVYPNSSADQYTAYVYGVWRYAKSSICQPQELKTATQLMVEIARLVESFGDNIPREDMKPSIYGDTAAITPDRACRLLEFYKAAYDLSGDSHWQDLYMEKVEEKNRARLSSHYGREEWNVPLHTYPVLQSQAAFRLLFETETDPELREAYRKSLEAQALGVIKRIDQWKEIVSQPSAKVFPARWRDFWPSFIKENSGYDPMNHTDWERFRKYCIDHAEDCPMSNEALSKAKTVLPSLRDQTESLAVVMLCDEMHMKRRAAATAWSMLIDVDWSLVGQAYILEALDIAYWRGVKSKIFPCH